MLQHIKTIALKAGAIVRTPNNRPQGPILMITCDLNVICSKRHSVPAGICQKKTAGTNRVQETSRVHGFVK